MSLLGKTWLSLLLLFLQPGGTGSSHTMSPESEQFVLVKGGTFDMGDVWGDGPFAMSETPVHQVTVGDYLLARHEVTVGEFRSFVSATGYKTVAETDAGSTPEPPLVRDGETFYPSWKRHWFDQADDHPVVMVAWEDAIRYCNWLSRNHDLPPAYDKETGRLLDRNGSPTRDVRQVVGFRLPTEAEWEFAARERGKEVRFGNGQNIARAEEMNFDAAGTGPGVPSLRLPASNRHPYNEPGPYRDTTTPAASFRANALGLFDMSGNAWEWCTDTGGTGFTAEKQVNPCAQDTEGHVLRGGTYHTDAKACRVSARIDWGARAKCPASGFRVARTVN